MNMSTDHLHVRYTEVECVIDVGMPDHTHVSHIDGSKITLRITEQRRERERERQRERKRCITFVIIWASRV